MKNKGITLVALVVTIVIMLILAGVSIRLITGEDGLIERTQKAVGEYKTENEKEVIGMSVTSYKIGEYSGSEETKLGKSLANKSLENSSNWHMIKVGDKTYSSGWNYIEKGSNIDNYGEAKNSWLVNYDTGEIIQLEEDNYLSLSAGDMLAVKDSLIINVDSSIIDDKVGNNKAELEKQLGDNVELVNFNYNNESGLTSTSFNFDGVDDYIKVKYNNDTEIKSGITLEFYGKFNGVGKLYKGNDIFTDPYGNTLNGFLELSNDNERANKTAIRFAVDMSNSLQKPIQLVWSVGKTLHTIANGFAGNFESDGYKSTWDRFLLSKYNVPDSFDKDIYFSVTIDGNTETEIVYFNGKKVIER